MNFKKSLYSLLLFTVSLGGYLFSQMVGGTDINISLGIGLVCTVLAYRLLETWEHTNPKNLSSLTLTKLILSFGIPVVCVLLPGQTTNLAGLIGLIGLLALSATLQPPSTQTQATTHTISPSENAHADSQP